MKYILKPFLKGILIAITVIFLLSICILWCIPEIILQIVYLIWNFKPLRRFTYVFKEYNSTPDITVFNYILYPITMSDEYNKFTNTINKLKPKL